MIHLQHVAEVGPVILFCQRCIAFGLRSVLLVETAVLPDQQEPQRQGEQGRKEHECCADRHALDISRCLTIREHIGTQEGPALANNVEQDDAPAAASIRALIVYIGSVGRRPVDAISSIVNDLLRTHGRILAIDGKIPQAAKKTPK